MKIGFRIPSLKKRIAARTSPKRLIQNALGLKAPKGFGWITNPKKALYNKVYNKTSRGCVAVLILPVIIGIVLFSIWGCSSTIEKPKISSDIEYKITNSVIDKGLNRYLISVELNKVISENSIKEISQYLKNTNTEVSDLIIKYSLKNVQNVLWARVDYLPNYKLDLIGASEEQNKILDKANINDIENAEIIGRWKDLSSLMTRAFILYKKDKKYFMRWYYKDKTFDDISLKMQDNKYLVVSKDYDEWYIIEKNGSLGTYSSKGKFSESEIIN